VEENYKVKRRRIRGRLQPGRRSRKKQWYCFLYHRHNIWIISVLTEVQPTRPGSRSVLSGRGTSFPFIHIVNNGCGSHAVSNPKDIQSSYSVVKAIGTVIRSRAFIPCGS